MTYRKPGKEVLYVETVKVVLDFPAPWLDPDNTAYGEIKQAVTSVAMLNAAPNLTRRDVRDVVAKAFRVARYHKEVACREESPS